MSAAFFACARNGEGRGEAADSPRVQKRYDFKVHEVHEVVPLVQPKSLVTQEAGIAFARWLIVQRRVCLLSWATRRPCLSVHRLSVKRCCQTVRSAVSRAQDF